MDKKTFISKVKKGKLSRAEMIDRLSKGDIYKTDIKGDAKKYVDNEMYYIMGKTYRKKQFVKWLKSQSFKGSQKECPSGVKKAIKDDIISIFDKDIVKKLDQKCIDILVKKEFDIFSKSPGKKPDIKSLKAVEEDIDKKIMRLIEKLDTKKEAKDLEEKFNQLGISTKRTTEKKKSFIQSLKQYEKKKPSIEENLDKQMKKVKPRIPKEPSIYKIIMGMRNTKISNDKINKFFDKIVEQIKQNNTSNVRADYSRSTSTERGRSLPSSRSSTSFAAERGRSLPSSRSSINSDRSNKSSRESVSLKQKYEKEKVREPKIGKLNLITIPRRKRSRSRSSSIGSPISRFLPVYDMNVIAYTKRRKNSK